MEAVGVDVKKIRVGGSKTPYIQELLQFIGAGDPPFWRRDLGNVPKDWEEPGQVLSQCVPTADKYST